MPKYHCYVALYEGKLVDWKFAIRQPAGSPLYRVDGKVVDVEERRVSGTIEECRRFAQSFKIHAAFEGSAP